MELELQQVNTAYEFVELEKVLLSLKVLLSISSAAIVGRHFYIIFFLLINTNILITRYFFLQQLYRCDKRFGLMWCDVRSVLMGFFCRILCVYIIIIIIHAHREYGYFGFGFGYERKEEMKEGWLDEIWGEDVIYELCTERVRMVTGLG